MKNSGNKGRVGFLFFGGVIIQQDVLPHHQEEQKTTVKRKCDTLDVVKASQIERDD